MTGDEGNRKSQQPEHERVGDQRKQPSRMPSLVSISERTKSDGWEQCPAQPHDRGCPGHLLVPAIINKDADRERERQLHEERTMSRENMTARGERITTIGITGTHRDEETQEQAEPADDVGRPEGNQAGGNRSRRAMLRIPLRIKRVVENHPTHIGQRNAQPQAE